MNRRGRNRNAPIDAFEAPSNCASSRFGRILPWPIDWALVRTTAPSFRGWRQTPCSPGLSERRGAFREDGSSWLRAQRQSPFPPKRGAWLPTGDIESRPANVACRTRCTALGNPHGVVARATLARYGRNRDSARCPCSMGEGRDGLGRKDLKWRQSMWSDAGTESRGSR